MVIVGNYYKAKVGGRALKQVECQRCGTEYVYVLERVAKGTGSTAYFIDIKGAKRRAHEEAEKKLARLLDRELDVVPCPECGYVQDDMVAEARRGRCRWLWHLGTALVLLAAFVAMIIFISGQGMDETVIDWEEFWAYAWIGPAVFLLWFVATRMYDPNADAERNRLRAEGRALTKAEWDRLAAEAEREAEGSA